MVAGFKLPHPVILTRALGAGSQSEQMMKKISAGQKGGKATSGLQSDPRKVIPLDDRIIILWKPFNRKQTDRPTTFKESNDYV